MTELIDIGSDLTPEGIRAINVGQVLTFEKDGERQSYKVVRRNLKKRKLLVRSVQMYKFSDDGNSIIKD